MYMKTLFSQNQRDDMPSTMLPTQGEGPSAAQGNGSTSSGNGNMTMPENANMNSSGNGNSNSQGNMQNANESMTNNNRENRPVTPLPNPGEGGAAFPGTMTPGIMMPGISLPGQNNQNNQNNQSNRPVTPLPYPGEGGPAFPGPSTGNGMGTGTGGGGFNIPAIIGTIITSFPRPNAPCRFCANQNQTYGNVRFLNAASGYNPFRVYVNDQLFVSQLNFSELTSYEKVPSGYQIVTVMGDNQYIYIQKPVMMPKDGSITVAICNTENGIDLFAVSDSSCAKSNYLSCLRVCNLSFNSGPLSVILGNNDLRFMNVDFQEVTNFRVLSPADYIFYVMNGNRNIILSSSLNVKMDVSYTMYLFNWNISSPDAITVVVVEEH